MHERGGKKGPKTTSPRAPDGSNLLSMLAVCLSLGISLLSLPSTQRIGPAARPIRMAGGLIIGYGFSPSHCRGTVHRAVERTSSQNRASAALPKYREANRILMREMTNGSHGGVSGWWPIEMAFCGRAFVKIHEQVNQTQCVCQYHPLDGPFFADALYWLLMLGNGESSIRFPQTQRTVQRRDTAGSCVIN